jgi:hypothetical protein
LQTPTLWIFTIQPGFSYKSIPSIDSWAFLLKWPRHIARSLMSSWNTLKHFHPKSPKEIILEHKSWSTQTRATLYKKDCKNVLIFGGNNSPKNLGYQQGYQTLHHDLCHPRWRLLPNWVFIILCAYVFLLFLQN